MKETNCFGRTFFAAVFIYTLRQKRYGLKFLVLDFPAGSRLKWQQEK